MAKVTQLEVELGVIPEHISKENKEAERKTLDNF